MDTPNFKKGHKPNEIANDELKEMFTNCLMTVLPQAMRDVIKSRSDLNGQSGISENHAELLHLKIDKLDMQLSQLIGCITQLSERTKMSDPIYTLEEALGIMKISVDTFRRRVKAGKIRCKKDGAVIYVRRSDIEAYWAGLEYVK